MKSQQDRPNGLYILMHVTEKKQKKKNKMITNCTIRKEIFKELRERERLTGQHIL